MNNDKLAEALRDSIFVAAMLDAICETDGTVDRMSARDAARRVREALQAHAAEATLCKHGELLGSDGCEKCSAEAAQPTYSLDCSLADKVELALRDAGFPLDEASALSEKLTAQPPAASVTDAMVERACKKYAFREDGAAFPDAYSDEEVLAERTLMREFLEHVLLATAPQQAAEPVYQYQETPDSWVDCDYDLYNASGDPKRILYTRPQPAQDAKLPSDEDFRLHLGELTPAELRVAQAAFRYAMAKESGR